MQRIIDENIIKELRNKAKLSQNELALRLNVSPKTISKWETGKGYPDISILEPLCKELDISLDELFSGDLVTKNNSSFNMLNADVYVCENCGNVIISADDTSISCHWTKLKSLKPKAVNEEHHISYTKIENEYCFKINHIMEKEHYISFAIGIYYNGYRLIKLYPEQECSFYLTIRGLKRILYFCNKHGLFIKNI